jgi:hypothetical protein
MPVEFVRLSRAVPRGRRANEHPGARSAQGHRVDPGPFEGFPADFQQEPLLRIHGECFPGTDPEESGVEFRDVVHESAVARVGGPGVVRVGVEQSIQLPAAIRGELRDRIRARRQQFPQVVWAADTTRKPAAHRHDRDWLVRHRRCHDHRRCWRLLASQQLGPQQPGEHDRGGVVEDQGGGQPQPGRGIEPVPQFHGGQRVEPKFLEGPVWINGVG